MRVAMYLRLSSEDGDLKDTGKAESESISNQRGLLQNFISSRSEFSGAEISEFCDDGWSGKNFERPDFLRMMEQVKQGQIHCIVVKDLSRFGRDYLVVGNYISRVFPFMGVRFIAVNDGFDSSRPQDIDSLDTSFKTLIYDLYSRELSGKVKNAKRMRAEKGFFLSPFAPYGYVKDPEDKICLTEKEFPHRCCTNGRRDVPVTVGRASTKKTFGRRATFSKSCGMNATSANASTASVSVIWLGIGIQ